MTEQKKEDKKPEVNAALLKAKFIDEAANYVKSRKQSKPEAFFCESILWLKRLMIITGIYFYCAHLIAAVIESKLTLFEMNGAAYSIISESIMGKEIKAKYDAQMAKEGK